VFQATNLGGSPLRAALSTASVVDVVFGVQPSESVNQTAFRDFLVRGLGS
jgi:hypothetical protein